MSLPDGQLGSALSSPVETGRPLLQQRTPPERVSPPRQDVTPYTAAKDHVRRLERSRGTRRARRPAWRHQARRAPRYGRLFFIEILFQNTFEFVSFFFAPNCYFSVIRS